MSKYSYQFKKEVVQAYLEGKGSCAFFAKQYGIKSKSQIRRWIANYKAYGDKGLLRSRKQNSYSFETKLAIVQLYLSSELSYQDIAIQMGIMNASLVAQWVSRFRLAGLDALRGHKKGRKPTMDKQEKRKRRKANAPMGRFSRYEYRSD